MFEYISLRSTEKSRYEPRFLSFCCYSFTYQKIIRRVIKIECVLIWIIDKKVRIQKTQRTYNIYIFFLLCMDICFVISFSFFFFDIPKKQNINEKPNIFLLSENHRINNLKLFQYCTISFKNLFRCSLFVKSIYFFKEMETPSTLNKKKSYRFKQTIWGYYRQFWKNSFWKLSSKHLDLCAFARISRKDPLKH